MHHPTHSLIKMAGMFNSAPTQKFVESFTDVLYEPITILLALVGAVCMSMLMFKSFSSDEAAAQRKLKEKNGKVAAFCLPALVPCRTRGTTRRLGRPAAPAAGGGLRAPRGPAADLASPPARPRPRPPPAGGKKGGGKVELRAYSRAEVAVHAGEADLWVVLRNARYSPDTSKVYDLTEYVESHPGGVEALLQHAGGDASEGFHGPQHPPHVQDLVEEYCIGTLAD